MNTIKPESTMLRKLLLLVLLSVPLHAMAQANAKVYSSCGAASYATFLGQPAAQTMDENGNLCTSTAGSSSGGSTTANQGTAGTQAWPVSENYSGTPTQTSVSCGTSSGVLLAASSATNWEHFENAGSNTNNVWINVAGGAATTAAGSIELQPGQAIDFFAVSFLPTSAINCIASTGATSLTVVYK